MLWGGPDHWSPAILPLQEIKHSQHLPLSHPCGRQCILLFVLIVFLGLPFVPRPLAAGGGPLWLGRQLGSGQPRLCLAFPVQAVALLPCVFPSSWLSCLLLGSVACSLASRGAHSCITLPHTVSQCVLSTPGCTYSWHLPLNSVVLLLVVQVVLLVPVSLHWSRTRDARCASSLARASRY